MRLDLIVAEELPKVEGRFPFERFFEFVSRSLNHGAIINIARNNEHPAYGVIHRVRDPLKTFIEFPHKINGYTHEQAKTQPRPMEAWSEHEAALIQGLIMIHERMKLHDQKTLILACEHEEHPVLQHYFRSHNYRITNYATRELPEPFRM